MSPRRWRRALVTLAAMLAGYLIALAVPYLVRPPLILGQDAVSDAASAQVIVSLESAGGRTIVARPPVGTNESDLLVIVYPGGLVRPQAYEWLARALAARGHLTVIPELPFDLAVFGVDRAGSLVDRYGGGKQVVLAGHSLGGAMAAQYAAAQPASTPLRGLVLLAAYPPDGVDLRKAPLRALVLQAENDGVADQGKVSGAPASLPAGTPLVVIPGAVHAFFGRYGPQSGDGVPTRSRAEAEAAIIEAVDGFLDRLTGP